MQESHKHQKLVRPRPVLSQRALESMQSQPECGEAKEYFSWWTAGCYPGSIQFRVMENRLGNKGHDSLICQWVLPGAACHIFTKSNMLFCGWTVEYQWHCILLPKKTQSQNQNLPKNLSSDYSGKKNMEKLISHLFSVYWLCIFHVTFDNIIFIFFSKLLCFLSSWGRKVYASQALVIYSISFCP